MHLRGTAGARMPLTRAEREGIEADSHSRRDVGGSLEAAGLKLSQHSAPAEET